MRFLYLLMLAPAMTIPGVTGVAAQTAASPAAAGQTAAPRQSGTVKAVTPKDFVLTTAAGQDFAVTVPEKAKVLMVAPGSRDLNSAKPGTLADLAAGDRVIVSGTAGDSGPMLTATRVIVMKSGAIEASHAADEAAWQRGTGGIVKAVDPAAKTVTVSSGMRSATVTTTPATVYRRYAPGSVSFADAQKSDLAAINPGDQLRARGRRAADGSSLVAEEIVTGAFSNFSGVLSGVDPAAGTVTLKDLATKRTVTVAVTAQTDLRNLPANAAAMVGGRGSSAGGERAAAAATGAGGRSGGAGRTGMDLSRMLSRLPTETLADLKPGEAVMIVASGQQGGGAGQATAITLLSGVEQILAASPTGETTLSPWSIGGGSEAGEGGGGGEPPSGR